MQAGMLVGRSVFGGGVLLVASWWGRSWIIGALIVWILAALGAAAVIREVEPPPVRTHAGGPSGSFGGALVAMMRLRSTWIGLAFALVSAAAFEATGQLAGPFLVDRGVPTQTIGVFFGIWVVGAMLAGGLAGGAVSDRFGRRTTAAACLIGFVLVIVSLALIDLGGAANAASLMALLITMYLFVGAFTVVSYAIFMDLTAPRLGATQFSTFMAATNGCESWSAWSGGRLTAGYGYPAAFLVMSAVSLCGLPLLKLMRRAPAQVHH